MSSSYVDITCKDESVILYVDITCKDILFNGHAEHCVTRAPLLYFTRNWVALSFKVSRAYLPYVSLTQALLKSWHCQKGQSGLSQLWPCQDFQGAWFQSPYLRIMTRDEKEYGLRKRKSCTLVMYLRKGKFELINGGKFLWSLIRQSKFFLQNERFFWNYELFCEK